MPFPPKTHCDHDVFHVCGAVFPSCWSSSANSIKEVQQGTGFSPTMFYYTALIPRWPPTAPVGIHVYSPPNEVIITDQMVAHVVTKVYVPPPEHPGDILMGAMSIAPIPSNPSLETYNSGLSRTLSPRFGDGHLCPLCRVSVHDTSLCH